MNLGIAAKNILEIPSERDSTPLWYSIDDYGVCTVAEAKALVLQRNSLLKAAKAVIVSDIILPSQTEYDAIAQLRAAVQEAHQGATMNTQEAIETCEKHVDWLLLEAVDLSYNNEFRETCRLDAIALRHLIDTVKQTDAMLEAAQGIAFEHPGVYQCTKRNGSWSVWSDEQEAEVPYNSPLDYWKSMRKGEAK